MGSTADQPEAGRRRYCDHQQHTRGHWPLGRIVRPLLGPDGVARTALVKTADGEYVRPVAKLCLLECALLCHVPYQELDFDFISAAWQAKDTVVFSSRK